MLERSVDVHVHHLDEARTIDEFRQKGYVLYSKGKPTIVTQEGFSKLTFLPVEDMPVEVEPAHSWFGGALTAKLSKKLSGYVLRTKAAILPVDPSET
jgi:hypothetical protein